MVKLDSPSPHGSTGPINTAQVKSTIEACGLLKRTVGDVLAEDQITLRALRDVNVPKFLNDDLPLFENIISDLFPDTVRPYVFFLTKKNVWIIFGNLLEARSRLSRRQILQIK